MSIFETLMLAASLCADCFAVSLCSSVTLRETGWRQLLLTSLAFAVIQSGLLLGIRGCGEGRNLNGWRNIILGGVATSIDAAAVGVSQSMSGAGTSGTVLLLAAVFLCTMVSVTAGISAGRAIGGIRGKNVGRIAEIAGGAVLTVIGLTFLF